MPVGLQCAKPCSRSASPQVVSRSLFSVIVISASVSASVSGSGLLDMVGAQGSGGGLGLILDSTALPMCCFSGDLQRS